MYGYVYITTDLTNGLIYIGQHVAPKFEPDRYIGSGTAFKKALKEHKRENFTCKLLEEASTQKELNNKEAYWIAYYDAMNPLVGYNLKEGGSGGKGYKHTPEDRIKCGDSWRGKKRPSRTAEHIAKLVASNAGFKHSEETKRQISSSLKGCVRSESTRKKMSTAQKGKQLSETTKQKLREVNRDALGKQVRCIETGQVFPTISKACRAFNCDGIRKCLYGVNKTGAGYHWEFIDV